MYAWMFLSLLIRTSRCRLHAQGPDDSAAEHQNNEPIATVDEQQLRTAHGEAIVDQHGGEHEAAPAEQAGQCAVAQRQLAKMAEQTAEHPGDDQVRQERIDEWQKGARAL